MNYIVLSLLAASCFAIGQIINKLMSKHGINNRDSLMAYFLLSTFSFDVFLLPFIPLRLPSLEILGLLLIIVATFLVGYYCFYIGIFHSDASSFAPLFQIQAILIALFAFIFLGERFPIQNYIFMAVMIVGVILVSLNEKMSLKTFMTKGVFFILMMQLLHSISNVFIGFALKSMSSLELLWWENLYVGVAFVLFYLIKRPKMNYKGIQVAPMFLSCFTVEIGIIALFTAFSVNLTISSILAMLGAPIVFMISLVASHFLPEFLEHHPPKVYIVRGLGLLLILLAAYKITVG